MINKSSILCPVCNQRCHFVKGKCSENEVSFDHCIGDERNAALDEAATECVKALTECDTLNLLHGADRIRALKTKGVI